MSTLALFASCPSHPVSLGAAIDWEDSELGQSVGCQDEVLPHFTHASRANGFKNGDKIFPRDPTT